MIDWLHGGCASRGSTVTRFQQLSAPVAAKSVEDTAFYRYGKLLSRNDVGFDVERFGDTAADFHARMQRRQATQPHGMLATATHDHKRGEDVRARLAVLSEKPVEWTNGKPAGSSKAPCCAPTACPIPATSRCCCR